MPLRRRKFNNILAMDATRTGSLLVATLVVAFALDSGWRSGAAFAAPLSAEGTYPGRPLVADDNESQTVPPVFRERASAPSSVALSDDSESVLRRQDLGRNSSTCVATADRNAGASPAGAQPIASPCVASIDTGCPSTLLDGQCAPSRLDLGSATSSGVASAAVAAAGVGSVRHGSLNIRLDGAWILIAVLLLRVLL